VGVTGIGAKSPEPGAAGFAASVAWGSRGGSRPRRTLGAAGFCGDAGADGALAGTTLDGGAAITGAATTAGSAARRTGMIFGPLARTGGTGALGGAAGTAVTGAIATTDAGLWVFLGLPDFVTTLRGTTFDVVARFFRRATEPARFFTRAADERVVARDAARRRPGARAFFFDGFGFVRATAFGLPGRLAARRSLVLFFGRWAAAFVCFTERPFGARLARRAIVISEDLHDYHQMDPGLNQKTGDGLSD
jgi:hypothetical protein